jgi:hypothetical protein
MKNIYALDVNGKRLNDLLDMLPHVNIYHQDFLVHYDFMVYNDHERYDVIVTNPPFIIKQKTMWPLFVKQCMMVLKQNGFLCIIIPSIWMKPQHEMYNYLIHFDIINVKCFTNNEANKLFGGDARTPLCYLILQKRENNGIINIWDKYISSYIPFKLQNIPLPMYAPYIVNKLLFYVQQYGSLKDVIIKTNCPSTKVNFSMIKNNQYKYTNIRTCKIGGSQPNLVYDYSDVPLKFHSKRKVILANKMYGIPFYDRNGEYGLSTRDNYIYIEDDVNKCKKIFNYLNSKLIFLIYESTRYRMCYLEKYAFELIPNILNSPIHDINDDILYKLFHIESREIQIIEQFFKRLRHKPFTF